MMGLSTSASTLVMFAVEDMQRLVVAIVLTGLCEVDGSPASRRTASMLGRIF
jgi:hypothetical protein